MKNHLLIGLFTLLFIGTGLVSCGAEDGKDTMDRGSVGSDDAMSPKMEKGDATIIPDEANFFSTKELQPRVVPFTTEDAAAGLAAKGPTIYFFAATWCPNCQAMYEDLQKNVSRLPSKVTIILVNYDTQSALKQKYGVTYQHTYVQIDTTGKRVAVWSGSLTVADLLKHIVQSST